MPHIIAITRSITCNALYPSPSCLSPYHLFPPIFCTVADCVALRYLLPKNTDLAEAAAVGGWLGDAWELELNHMCV
jgi:hypothetical protein